MIELLSKGKMDWDRDMAWSNKSIGSGPRGDSSPSFKLF